MYLLVEQHLKLHVDHENIQTQHDNHHVSLMIGIFDHIDHVLQMQHGVHGHHVLLLVDDERNIDLVIPDIEIEQELYIVKKKIEHKLVIATV